MINYYTNQCSSFVPRRLLSHIKLYEAEVQLYKRAKNVYTGLMTNPSRTRRRYNVKMMRLTT